MPPRPKRKPAAAARAAALRHFNDESVFQRFLKKYINFKLIGYFFFDAAALPAVTVFILLTELFLNIWIIDRVPYTEIDWKAYMQECEGFLNGTTNYALLKGDTGPLVYPAAFVYIFSALYFITSQGQNIRLAQYIFALIYFLQLWLVLRLYTKSRKVPPYVLIVTTFTAYRIHSIYVLRLFNDPIAMLFLYASLNLFVDRRWTWGSLFFSLGVGCKMNILLFAPALLLFYLANLGVIKTIMQLAVCGIVQLLLGLPFLLTYPWEYIKGSFDFGRVFEHKWTVNYRFLPREIFENKSFHIALLVVHAVLLMLFVKPTMIFFKNYARIRFLQSQLQPQLDQQNKIIKDNKDQKKKSKGKQQQQQQSTKTEKKQEKDEEQLTEEQQKFIQSLEKGLQKQFGSKLPTKEEEAEKPEDNQEENVSVYFDQCTQLALLPFFLCNFIGVVCARSLHYQFYVWYYHSIPYLAWSTNYSLIAKYFLLAFIELCWKVYPSTNLSSIILQICHLLLLYGVGRNMFKIVSQSDAVSQETEQVVDETKEKTR